MATGLQKESRFRALRGKSVSEHRRVFDQSLSGDMDGITPPPLRVKPSWRKLPKTQQHTATAHNSVNDVHSHLTPVPPLPLSQKEHTSTTRPKAAVMPPPPEFGPEFGPSRSPTPLGAPHEGSATSPLMPTVDDIACSDKNATSGVLAGGKGPQDPVEQHDKQPNDMEGLSPVLLTPPRVHSLLSQTEAETDRMLAEQKRLLHQHLMSTEFAGASVTSLTSASASTFTFETRTPPKNLRFGRIGSFVRGRTSRATLSPASSTSPSLSSTYKQSIEPLLPSSARTEYAQQLMTPPASPIFSPHGSNGVSHKTDDSVRDACLHTSDSRTCLFAIEANTPTSVSRIAQTQ